jgi:hypothetical protein
MGHPEMELIILTRQGEKNAGKRETGYCFVIIGRPYTNSAWIMENN